MAFSLFKWIVTLIVVFLAGSMILGGVNAGWDTLQDSTAANAELVTPVFQVLGGLALLVVIFWFLWSDSPVRRNIENIFSIPELLGKLAFTLALLCIYRVGFHVPLPGLDQDQLLEAMKTTKDSVWGQALQTANMFSGGNLQRSTLFGLGIMPYISASIIMQLLTTVLPSLERLKKEGAAGYKKIQEYTRYLTVGLCLVQAIGWMAYMRKGDMLYIEYTNSLSVMLMCVAGLTAGTIFLMWLGEQIDEYGIGNGISLLIMAGIVTRMPTAIKEFAGNVTLNVTQGGKDYGPGDVLVLIGMFLFVVAGAILITQAERRIPVQQAKHTRGRRTYGGQREHMPLKINQGGVMPIIFASALMMFPGIIFSTISDKWPNRVTESLTRAFGTGQYVYAVVFIGLIYFFAYFWTTVQFRPKENAEKMRDHGSFIPGLRPGKRTADYLEKVMERITFCGAAFLALVAVLPMVLSQAVGIPPRISGFLGGTGLLIMVSVALQLVQSIEANLVMRNYGGFLGGSSRIKGSR